MIELLFVMMVLMLGGLVVGAIFFALFGFLASLAFGMAMFGLLKVLPLLLVGWIAYRYMQRRTSRRAISASDDRWLDG